MTGGSPTYIATLRHPATVRKDPLRSWLHTNPITVIWLLDTCHLSPNGQQISGAGSVEPAFGSPDLLDHIQVHAYGSI
jgi:hypothetical protein